MRLLVAILCSLLSAGLPLLAQGPAPCDRVLSGRVLDEHDRSPLSFAHVQIVGTGRSVQADEQGRFRLEGLCPGAVVLRFAHVGCETQERTLQLDRDLSIDLFLEHHADELKELEVARKRPDEHVGQAHATVQRDELQRRSGEGLAAAVESVTGVSVLRSGPTIGKPVIHGLSGNRVVVLNQGIRQEDQQWGGDHAPNIDPLSSDRVTVVKGAASVQYGADAIGGVVITEPVDLPTRAGLRGETQLAYRWNGRGGGAAALLEGGVARVQGLGWRVQGSGVRTGDLRSPDHVLSNTGNSEGGISGSIGLQRQRWGAKTFYSYYQRELGIMRTAHIGNLSDLRRTIASGTPWYEAPFTYAIDAPRQYVQHHLLKAEAYYRPAERGQLVFTYGFQSDDRQEYDIRRGGRTALPALDLYLTSHTGDVVYKHWIGSKMHGRFGFNGAYQQNSNVPGTGVRPLIPNYRRVSGALFLVEHYPLNDRLELEAGVRMESTRLEVFTFDERNGRPFNPEHGFTNHALSVGANWTVRDSLRVRASVSSAFRPPHVSELYSEGVHHGAAAIEVGDASLRDERAWSGSIDLEHRHGPLQVQATLHAAHINNYIHLRPDGFRLTIRGAFPEFRYVATDALLYGGDLLAQVRLSSSFSYRFRGSVLYARDRGADTWLYQIPADRMEHTLQWTRDRTGAWRGLYVAVTGSFVAHQSRVPPGVDFMEAPAAYQLLGLSMGIRKPLKKGTLHLLVDGYNLTNARYRDLMDRFRYYADARGTDINVRIRYSFGQ